MHPELIINFCISKFNLIVIFLFLLSQVDKGVVPLAGTCGETTTQGQTQTALVQLTADITLITNSNAYNKTIYRCFLNLFHRPGWAVRALRAV